MVLTELVEHDSVACNALSGQMTELENGEWRPRYRPKRQPHSYTLQFPAEPPWGVEPQTYALRVRRSNRLS